MTTPSTLGQPAPEATEEVWYRYEDKTFAGPLDESDNPTPAVLQVHRRAYKVIKKTPKGVWLHLGFGQKRLVLRGTTKRWACPTDEEARASFKARKLAQIGHHQAVINRVRDSIRLAEMDRVSKYGPI